MYGAFQQVSEAHFLRETSGQILTIEGWSKLSDVREGLRPGFPAVQSKAQVSGVPSLVAVLVLIIISLSFLFLIIYSFSSFNFTKFKPSCSDVEQGHNSGPQLQQPRYSCWLHQNWKDSIMAPPQVRSLAWQFQFGKYVLYIVQPLTCQVNIVKKFSNFIHNSKHFSFANAVQIQTIGNKFPDENCLKLLINYNFNHTFVLI